MGSSAAINQVADIMEKMPAEGKVAVVSATSGTTDKLIALAEAALSEGPWEKMLEEIIEKHENIVKELGISESEIGKNGVNLEKFWEQM